MNDSIVNDDGKVFDSCSAIYIYPNGDGSITIKQAETPVNNVFVYIPIDQIEKVVSALRRAKREQLESI